MIQRVLQALVLLRRHVATERLELPALPPRTARLFNALSRHDQHHLIAVYQALGADAETSVAIAGLLHDIGKVSYSGDTIGLIARSLHVLLKPSPGLHELIGREGVIGIRSELWRIRHHAELGADRLVALGWPAHVSQLVRDHESAIDEPSILALRRADDANH